MKIVFVNPVGAIGGAEKALLIFIETLVNQQQYPMELYLIVGTEGILIEKAQKLGVQVKLLKLPQAFNELGDSAFKQQNNLVTFFSLLKRVIKVFPSLINYSKEFKQFLEQIKPDLIHSNGIKTHLLTVLAKPEGIPLIWHIHDFYGSRPLIAKLFKCISHRARLGIAISQAVAKDASIVLPNLPIKVIYNATDINYFSPEYLPAHAPLRVGLVATFARWKGQNIFLKAIAELTRKYPKLQADFYIVGGPIYETKGSQFSQTELEEQALNLGIIDKINFLGFQQDIVDIYRWLDIVIHASVQPEPFGLTIIEAMACAKPVIVAQAGGAAELFTPNYDAIGISPGDPTALAEAILDLVNNVEKRQMLSENARKTAIKNFSHQRLGKQLMEIYQTILTPNIQNKEDKF